MKECENQEKDVILTFDAISLDPSLHYDSKEDRIVGFEDKCCSSSTVHREAANSMLVFMIRSISGRWKQPIGYYATKNGMASANLQKVLIKILYELHTIGLRVCPVDTKCRIRWKFIF